MDAQPLLAKWCTKLRGLEKAGQPFATVRAVEFERALKELPGSYKLWAWYLRELRRYIRSTRERSFADSADAMLYETVNIVFERALEHMHKMPRVWIDFCEHLEEQRLITRTRKTYNRALRALPPTQHWRIWERLLAFVGRIYVRETAACVWHRFVDFDPTSRPKFLEFVLKEGREDYAAALTILSSIVEQESAGREPWAQFCDIVSAHPEAALRARVDADATIRRGIERFPSDSGELWNALAEHHTRLGDFSSASKTYEEALEEVQNMRDFGRVFDAYSQFREGLVEAKLNAADDAGADAEMELFEALLERRKVLANAVRLRQERGNVALWLERSA